MQHPALLRANRAISTPPDPLTAPDQTAGTTPPGDSALSRQKMVEALDLPGQPIERDHRGVWHIRRYDEARALLRHGATKQAGFAAELVERMPPLMRKPILYQEGTPHQSQRKQIARFFTPKAVDANYPMG